MDENVKKIIWEMIRGSYFLFDDLLNITSNIRLARNIKLKNKHQGERVFLLLTGESIQRINIKSLKNEITFGTNLIILHEDIKDVNLTYFSNLDDNRTLKPDLQQWPAEIIGDLGNNGALKFYREINIRLPKSTTLILNSFNYKHYKNEPSIKNRTIFYCKKGINLALDENVPIGKITDMTKRLQGRGQFYYSIIMLMYMGFKEIYLCGSGYTYDPMHYLHFYDMQPFMFPLSIGYEAAERETKKQISIRNRKYSSNLSMSGLYEKNGFFRAVITRPTNELETTIKQHEMVNRYAKSHGVKIINIVPDGFESPVFEKTTWTEVLKTLN
jgi:hypothetical protein